MDRRAARAAMYRRRRQRVAIAGIAVLVLLAAVIVLAWPSSGGAPSPSTNASSVPSIEAGVASWQFIQPLSRETVVSNGSGFTVLGGLDPAGASLSSVYTTNPSSGATRGDPALATPVHDGSGGVLGTTAFVFGGGSPTTVPTVQSASLSPPGSSTPGGAGRTAGSLPEPRSDSAAVTVTDSTGTTAYVVGGYNGATYLSDVLATTDGAHFRTVATLKVPVRYPALAAIGGMLYAFGGQIASPGATVAATDVIQRIDPASHTVTVVATLPEAMYGAAAFTIGGAVYVAGGQVPGGNTLTEIDAFVPSTDRVLHAGLLPQAEAFGGYTTVGTGTSAVGYIVGGEVAHQSGPDQAGVASGTLRTVISIRPSAYGGAAGPPSAGSPFGGSFLIADRGNDRLLLLSSARGIEWIYPSATKPPPPGGFYFPDDSFFFSKGTGIISNQEDNHTIVEIAYPSGKILWQYGHPGVTGSQPGYLNQPDDAYLLKSGIVTVADASNNRILFISPQGRPVGQIGNGVDAHVPGTSVAYPNGDTPLANGDVLVSEINGSWIDEYTPSGHMVWSVHMTSVNYPSDPQQLGPDTYLMTDYNPPGEGRVLMFDRAGTISWYYDAKAGDARLYKPSLAERLPSGLIMVNDDYRNRVVAIDPKYNTIVWQYGLTDVAGTATGLLAIPDGFDLLEAGGFTPTHPQTK